MSAISETFNRAHNILEIVDILPNASLTRGTEFSSYETELRKMTSHFELLSRKFV